MENKSIDRLIFNFQPEPNPSSIYTFDELGLPTNGVAFTHEGQNWHRPYIIFNMVSSIDGKSTTSQNDMTGLGTPTDRYVLNQLRSQVDAVLVGATTLRSDQFIPTLPESLVQQRQPHFSPQPLGIVISQSGNLPLEHRFWQAGATLRLVFTPKATPELSTKAQVFNLDIPAMLNLLWSQFGVKRLLVEGGATTNYEFIRQGWGDELFLTLCPKLVGGNHNLTILGGDDFGLGNLLDLKLRSLYCHDHELFLRYQITNQPAIC